MRGLIMFMAMAGIGGGLFLWQKQHAEKSQAVTTEAAAQAPDSTRQTYEHDWAKHSLDTTHGVIDKIKQQRRDDDLKDAVGRR